MVRCVTFPAVGWRTRRVDRYSYRRKSPRLEAIVDYLVALNTDYNALAEELCTAKLEISVLRAQITPSMPLFNPVYYPPRKRVRYNDPTARTYIRHP
ncbi:hypothetical protein U9M48_023593 [Paspalum notatum var. saurae]|uniref:Uncharacterized protein n=1 Tax=Paspalum notatum var. saurae TaxID=547442 RepID=A0AAQ3WUV6_PASNO